MGGAVTPTLAAAVSNAGALGMLPLTWTPPKEMAAVIEEMRELTERPFGVNLGLAWDQRERLASALTAGAPVISFFWGDAGHLIGEAHEAGALVFVTVGTGAEGQAAAAAGADVIVAQGWEAGGHVSGTVSTLALVPRVVDAVAPVPVVAAGGIADGRGLAAALALGATGAWVGTRFLAAHEAAITPTTGAASLPPAKPTRFTERSSTAAGPMHHTAHSATRQSRPGSVRVDPRRDRGPGKRTSRRRGPTARRSTATPRQHRPPRCQVTSNRFRTGQD